MIKYYRVTADYRPNNPNKPTYDFKIIGDTPKIKNSVLKKEIKKYFENLVTWLKVYNVEEITEQQCKKQVFRTLKIKK